MARFTRTIQFNKRAGSYTLVIPRPIVEGLGLKKGEKVEIVDSNEGFIVKPVRRSGGDSSSSRVKE